MVADKPVHKKEFKELYKRIADSQCFVATALLDVQAEATTPHLRKWRDETLRFSQFGRAFIYFYYSLGFGQLLAAITERMPHWVRRALGQLLDRIAIRVSRGSLN